MNIEITKAEKARFTRALPLELKTRWKLGEDFKLPLLFYKSDAIKKRLITMIVQLTAMYDSVLEYRYMDPVSKEYNFGLVDVSVFIEKATK